MPPNNFSFCSGQWAVFIAVLLFFLTFLTPTVNGKSGVFDHHGKASAIQSEREVNGYYSDEFEYSTHDGTFRHDTILLSKAKSVKEVKCVDGKLNVEFDKDNYGDHNWAVGDQIVFDQEAFCGTTTHVLKITSIETATNTHLIINGESKQNIEVFDQMKFKYSSYPIDQVSNKDALHEWQKRARVTIAAFGFNSKSDGSAASNPTLTFFSDSKVSVNGKTIKGSVICSNCYAFAGFGIDVDLDWGLFYVNYAKFSFWGGVDVNIDISATFEGAWSVSLPPVVLIPPIDLPSLVLVVPTPVPIPLVFTPSISLEAEVSLELSANVTASVGFGYHYNVELGFEFNKGQWNTIKTSDSQYHYHPFTVYARGEASLQFALRPVFSIDSSIAEVLKFNWGIVIAPNVGVTLSTEVEDDCALSPAVGYQLFWGLDLELRLAQVYILFIPILSQQISFSFPLIDKMPLRCTGCYGCFALPSTWSILPPWSGYKSLIGVTDPATYLYQTAWICRPDLFPFPFRINSNNDVECMSNNARDCLWGMDCQTSINNAASYTKPLTCGKGYQNVYGTTGYQDVGTFCNVIRNLVSGWGCVPSLYVMRVFNGNIQCLADSAHKCLNTKDLCNQWALPNSMIFQVLTNPLSCGNQLLNLTGSTGYDTPYSWCRTGILAYTEWHCLPKYFHFSMRIMWGDVQCFSYDGQTCDDNVCTKSRKFYPEARPITCGNTYYYWNKVTGYEDPNHWCSVGLTQLSPWYCIPKLPILVRYLNGSVQCLSYDGKNCVPFPPGNCTSRSLIYTDTQPVTCTAAQYGQPTHWCAVARPVMTPFMTTFTALPNMKLRIYNNNLQCLSQNGTSCWLDPFYDTWFQSFPFGMAITCTNTNYSNTNSWCYIGLSELSPWMCLTLNSIDYVVRLFRGDFQCPSRDGVSCILNSCSAVGAMNEYSGMKLVSCNTNNRYNDPNYPWCAEALYGLQVWSCVPGISTPVRYWNGVIQCLSYDGSNCAWGQCPNANRDMSRRIFPFACTSTQMSDPNPNWCSTSYNYFLTNGGAFGGANTMAVENAWSCIPGISTPVRYWIGVIQCLSYDGSNCMWGQCPNTNRDISKFVFPLGCTTTQMSDPNPNWCSTSYKYFVHNEVEDQYAYSATSTHHTKELPIYIGVIIASVALVVGVLLAVVLSIRSKLRSEKIEDKGMMASVLQDPLL